jgi:RimJ/RimL family protein N-acetyltransferase
MNPILTVGEYEVFDLVLTPEKLKWMWEQLMAHPALALEYGPPGARGFVDMLMNANNIYFEVVKEGIPVGVLFMTDINDPRLREIHAIFYDSALSNKVKVCQELAKYVFTTYAFQRLTAAIPESFGATARLLQKVGFRMEGKKKKAAFIKTRWQDVLMFGLLPEYLEEGKNAQR